MREWRARYGRLPSSYDWSRTHARRRGGEALERLAGGEWPAASVVGRLFGTWAAARTAASVENVDSRAVGRSGRADRLPPARPPLRRADRLRRRLDRPRDAKQPVGDTGRHEPRHPDAIVDAELERALEDPDPLRGIAQLAARLGAAFVLDPAGVTRTKALGSDRMARKLADALPGGDDALRASVWDFMRPMLSPALDGAEPRHVHRATNATRRPSTSAHIAPRRTSTSSISTTSRRPNPT